MAASQIEWTEATWNPVAGCTMVSPGCTNCYAMRIASRLEAMGHTKYQGTTRRTGGRSVWSGGINFDERVLRAPLTWPKPQRIFVNSMSDLFHEEVGIGMIQRIWEVMEQANWHTFQILSKRPVRMRNILSREGFPILRNAWLGTSVESATYASRIDYLRTTPAVVRFISFEPLLAPVGPVDLSGIHWAIIGGESGPAARPMHREWVRELKTTCDKQKVAFFFKQWGGTRKKKTGRLLDGRTWDDYPTAPVSGTRSGAAVRVAA